LTLADAKPLKQGNSGNTGVFKDVDHDGDVDLLVEFYSNQLNLDSHSTEAVLEGALLDGVDFSGVDTVH
jgi:predicted nucleotidyltransferase